jgi:glycosyltransferase involved in cell wall biosynthesis
MRILIDGRNLELAEGTGIRAYAGGLCAMALGAGHALEVLCAGPGRARGALARAGAVRTALRPLRPARIEAFPGLPVGATAWRIDDVFRTARAKFAAGLGFTAVEWPCPVDVAHWTCPLPLYLPGARNLYTIHDLVPLSLPDSSFVGRNGFARLVSAIVRRAERIVTVSQASRAEIVAQLGADPRRVVVAPPPVTAPPPAQGGGASATEAILARLVPERRLGPGDYYLFVGAMEPKKNLRRIVEAHRAAAVAEPLLVVGRPGWACEADMAAVAAAPDAIALGWLPAGEVAALLAGARALIFASLAEGFGLPIVEAFLQGTPVLTSNRSGCAETAGGAAMLVDPLDTGAIRDAIRTLSAPDSGGLRRALAQRGRIRAADFAPARVAPRYEALWRPADGSAP